MSVAVLTGVCFVGTALADWSSFSVFEPGQTPRFLGLNPHAPIVWVASDKNLYQQASDGSWKRTLGVRGNQRLSCMIIDPLDPQLIYVGSSSGIRQSLNGGKNWKEFLPGPVRGGVHCLSMSKRLPGVILVGTEKGLLLLNKDGSFFGPGKPFGESAVYAILPFEKSDGGVILTSRGIYESPDWCSWKAVLIQRFRGEDDASLSETEPSEEPAFLNLAQFRLFKIEDILYAVTPKGIYRREPVGWLELPGNTLPSGERQAAAASSSALYLAAAGSVYRWTRQGFEPVPFQLPSTRIHDLVYDVAAQRLIAATDKGVFDLSYPEIRLEMPQLAKEGLTPPVLDLFEREPSIREIQMAAIHYAEVQPEKIQNWRKAASKKAWLPTLSLGGQMGVDETVDIDRGGTDDADHFIFGPNERDFNWSVGASWNLGELVWNDDQTSIDTRSKLMAELRDDILDEINRLYFERRRLQVAMTAAKSGPGAPIEQEIRLQELTAGLDALTGGYFSDHLKKTS